MPKRHKYASYAQTKIAFALLLALPWQKTLRNGGLVWTLRTKKQL